ncbi:MAG: hypothetical protein J5894_00880 [Clostridia bacterium]|nr:hypothetical protein [Clostridia bacterium]
MSGRGNNSYNDYMNRLHERYNGGNARSNVYYSSSEREVSEGNYRNGDFKGEKYMTSGDFIKYYNNRKADSVSPYMHTPTANTKEFKRPARPAAQTARPEVQAPSARVTANAQRTAVMPAARKNYDENADTIVMPAKKSVNTVRNRVKKMFDKWFGSDENEKTTKIKRKMPVAAITLLASLSIAMTMVVGTTVMLSGARSEAGNAKYEIKQLEKERDYLEEELVKKDDLAMIEEYATSRLGMIREDYVSSVYLQAGEGDSVEGRNESGFSALLSAIFGG